MNKTKIPGHCGFPLSNLQSVESLDHVLSPEIKEIYRLHNKILTDYDFTAHLATTIYSGTVIKSSVSPQLQ